MVKIEEDTAYVKHVAFRGPFLSCLFYVLGTKHMAADYYPNNDTNIQLGESVQWYVGVTDFRGNVQFIAVRVELGNQAIMPPDDLNAQPSQAALVTDFKRFLQNNET
jgi:uncharacterized membrane protein